MALMNGIGVNVGLVCVFEVVDIGTRSPEEVVT